VGIGLGGEIATALTIMSEMMPTRIRGAALGLINVAGGGFGIFVASALATVILGPLSGFLGGDGVAWRYLLGVLVVPALFVYYFRRYIPESPRFLVRVGKLDEVNRVLSQLASGKLRPVRNLTVTPYVRGVEGRVFAREKTRMAEMFHGVLLRRTATLWVMEVMTFGAQVAVTSLMPIILVAKGFSVESSLRYALLINIGSLLGAIAAATSGHFLPRRATLCGGAILAAAASVGFGFAASTVSVIVFGLLTAFLFLKEARAAKMPKTSFPAAVVVSMAAPCPVSTFNPTPRAVRLCTVLTRWYGTENHEPDQESPASPVAVTDGSPEQQQRGEHEGVGVDHPRQLGLACVAVAGDRGQRHIQ